MTHRVRVGIVWAAFLLFAFSVEAKDEDGPTYRPFDWLPTMAFPKFALELTTVSPLGSFLDFPVWERFELSRHSLVSGPFFDGPVWQDFALHLRLRPFLAVLPQRSLVPDMDLAPAPFFWLQRTLDSGFFSSCPIKSDSFSTKSGQFNFNIGYQF